MLDTPLSDILRDPDILNFTSRSNRPVDRDRSSIPIFGDPLGGFRYHFAPNGSYNCLPRDARRKVSTFVPRLVPISAAANMAERCSVHKHCRACFNASLGAAPREH